jgi:hypothetical protein
LTPAAVVNALRDNRGQTVEQLAEALSLYSVPAEFQDSPIYTLSHRVDSLDRRPAVATILERLVSAGVLVYDGKYQVNEKWLEIARAMRVSLSALDDLSQYNATVVQPFFPASNRIQPLDQPGVFVAMPFDESVRPIFDDHIKKVAQGLELVARRGDDFFNSGSVMGEVWAAIVNARVVIADCTGRNPNVFYEIGIAHTVGIPVILITQHDEDMPFDLRHIRFLKYSYTPRGMMEFEAILQKMLRETLFGEQVGLEASLAVARQNLSRTPE